MRVRLIVSAVACSLILAACDGPPDAVSKDMTGPEGTIGAPGDDSVAPPTDRAIRTEPRADGSRLEAHEHGHATFAAAVDGEVVTFSFEAPLASLVGFEHEPETGEQTQALNTLKDAFVIPGNMVSINSEARCLPQMTSSGTHMSGGHGALEVEHVYTCENPRRIERIEFLMASDYPSLESIDAIFLSGTRQSAAELTPANPVLRVR